MIDLITYTATNWWHAATSSPDGIVGLALIAAGIVIPVIACTGKDAR